MSVTLLLSSAALSTIGALVTLLLSRHECTSKVVACLFGMAAAIISCVAGIMAVFGPACSLSLRSPFPFADLTVLMNPLAGLLTVVISVLAFTAWLYGLSYFDGYRGRGLGSLGFFMNLFVASMLMVVAADNAFWFLVFFELMSLTSYFLVVFDQNEAAVKGGYLYFFMAHIAFTLIMIAFLIMMRQTGSFEFSTFRAARFPLATASAVFVLAFLGFGIKAGMFPFHTWLPQAHPEAPACVSSLMSGGMIKVGIFGIIKVCFDLLGSSGGQLWWGLMVLAFGAASAIFGILFANGERDIKRMLAYCSVDNIGIILVGVAVGMIGWTCDLPLVAGLGLLAACYHLVNHAMFKGLLFLGSGSVLTATGTRNMDEMGGLARKMPVTAACFLLGAAAISAIPPLNGFVSEWFIYQSLLEVSFDAGSAIMVCAVCAAVILAITGALVVTCFVRAYGVTFLGRARSEQAENAHEVPVPMTAAMVVLAAICVVLGLGAQWVAPAIQGISASVLAASAIPVVQGNALVDAGTGACVSVLLIAVLLVVVSLVVAFVRSLATRVPGKAPRRDPWDCGYLPDAQMPAESESFSSAVAMFFGPAYGTRQRLIDGKPSFIAGFWRMVDGVRKVEPLGDRFLVDDIAGIANTIGRRFQKLEGGDFRNYIFYIVVALIFFLFLAAVVR